MRVSASLCKGSGLEVPAPGWKSSTPGLGVTTPGDHRAAAATTQLGQQDCQPGRLEDGHRSSGLMDRSSVELCVRGRP
jgi:hypothetical protein